jgi:hypothetical protein
MTATWNDLAGDIVATEPVATFRPSPEKQYVTIDITSLVQQWADGVPNHGLMLKASDDKESKHGSREREKTDERPFLEVSYEGGIPSGEVSLSSGADEDTFLREGDVDKNYGDKDKLEVKEKPGDGKRAVYRFDLSYIPQGATVNSAKLNLWIESDSDRPVSIHRVTDIWTEMTATWNNLAFDFDASELATFPPSPEKQHVTIDIKSLVQQWADGDVPNYGLMLIASDDKESKYGSREREKIDERPFLEVSYSNGGTGSSSLVTESPSDNLNATQDSIGTEVFLPLISR